MNKLFAFGIVGLLSFQSYVLSGDNTDSTALSKGDLLVMFNDLDDKMQKGNEINYIIVMLQCLLIDPNVAHAIKSNNKLDPQSPNHEIYDLLIPARIAKILKAFFRASQSTNSVASKYKKDLADLLVAAHSVWSSEDRIQKQNLEFWSDQLFDQIKQEKEVDAIAQTAAQDAEIASAKAIITKIEHEAAIQKPTQKPQKTSDKKHKKAQAAEPTVYVANVSRSAPRQQANAEIKHHTHSHMIKPALADLASRPDTSSSYEARLKRRKLKQSFAAQQAAELIKPTKASPQSSSIFKTQEPVEVNNPRRRKNAVTAQPIEQHSHALEKHKRTDEAQTHKPRTNQQKPVTARETPAPKPLPQSPSNSGTRSS